MAWRRPQDPPWIEAPGWYRSFDPAAWDVPDAQEQAMMDGNLGRPWPPRLREIHAQRRWNEAKYAYRKEHPGLASQEIEAIIADERRSRT